MSPHDDQIRARFAIRRGLSAMEAEEREMERAMRAFEEDADQGKRYIEAEWRREHWGTSPSVPLHGRLTDRHPSRAQLAASPRGGGGAIGPGDVGPGDASLP
jgi:hypothetical protein